MLEWPQERLAREAPPLFLSSSDIDVLTYLMGTNRRNNHTIPAGYTYFGQFVDHDLTFTHFSSPSRVLTPDEIPIQRRNPFLDLDSLYGGGLNDSVIPYQRASGEFVLGPDDATRERLRIDGHSSPKGHFFDLPRDDALQARTGDARNDENLLVAQLHVAFMRLHNNLIRIIDHDNPNNGFREARREVIRLYQWVTLHDYLKRLLPDPLLINKVLGEDFQLEDEELRCRIQKMPVTVEFAGAVFRFGHTMVRNDYVLNNRGLGRIGLADLFKRTGRGAAFSKSPYVLEPTHTVDWSLFFGSPSLSGLTTLLAEDALPNKARMIQTSVVEELTTLRAASGPIDLLRRNLVRGKSLRLPSGQDFLSSISATNSESLRSFDVSRVDVEQYMKKQTKEVNERLMQLAKNTPLWLYILIEAEAAPYYGKSLGPLGAWVIAHTLKLAVKGGPYSILDSCNPWTIEDSRVYQEMKCRFSALTPEGFGLAELLYFSSIEYPRAS